MSSELGLVPNHVAIIMDGNRRWAASKSKNRLYGHEQGVKQVSNIIEYSVEFGVSFLTLYAFSSENWSRSIGEIQNLKFLMKRFLDDYREDILTKNIRFRSMGNIEDFGKDIAKKIRSLEDQSQLNTGLNLTVALSYGARDEILRAVNNILSLRQEGEVTELDFRNSLYIKDIPDPDLMIRTGGESRLSNFLLWQLAYTELYFTDVYWPAFDKTEFQRALEFFAGKDRRYGGS
ncbi:MAG: di-trans,poly-cis-decaprenylcistransferase [Rickettsiales bacterium]|jgi:undecaprenyl diphosphate synthase|nr:di-trans,poly-cis-decaprenylcistransferase [Rickettsiales bacterium]